MAQGTIYVPVSGGGAVPQDYTTPGAAILDLLAVTAVFDGSGAGSDFFPAVQVLDSSGNVMATTVGERVAAGGSAEVTFAPFLRKAPSGTPGAATVTAWAYADNQALTVTNPAGGPSAQYAVWNRVWSSDPSVLNVNVARTFIESQVPGYMVVTCDVQWPSGAYSRFSSASNFTTKAGSTSDPAFSDTLTDQAIIPPPFGNQAGVLNFFSTFPASKTIDCRMWVAFVGLTDSNYTVL